MVSVLVAMPGSVLRFAYTAEIADRGAATLRILALGQGGYTMLAIATTVLASLGRERRAASITLAALFAVLFACVLLLSGAPFGGLQLQRTAIGTSGGLFAALAVAAFYVRKEAGGFVPLRTAVRVVLALSVAGAAGSFLPPLARAVTPFGACLVACVYFVVLALTRELTTSDAHALRALRS
jgi:membrane associated rhomboid family serine protease